MIAVTALHSPAVPKATSREIASAIPWTTAHRDTQERINTLRSHRLELDQRLATLCSRQAGGGENLSREIAAAEADNQRILREMAKERAVIAPLRAAHATRVTAALRPAIEANAKRARILIVELSVVLGRINDGREAIRNSGGEALPVRASFLVGLDGELSRLLAER